MTLPEQGDFNEKLDTILKSIIESYAPYYKDQGLNIEYSVFQKHKAAIRTLVLDEIIGEDEHYDKSDPLYKLSGEPFEWAERNQLRDEQRKKLEDSHGTK